MIQTERNDGKRLAAIVLAVALPTLALACVGPSYATVRYHGNYVETPPPAPYFEEVPAAPGIGYAWIPGYWYWSGYDYASRSSCCPTWTFSGTRSPTSEGDSTAGLGAQGGLCQRFRSQFRQRGAV